MARIGVLALARPTFDVPLAEAIAARAFAALDRGGHRLVGSRALLFDAAAAESAMEALAGESLDLLLILQVTFTDASMTVKIATNARAPLAIWAEPFRAFPDSEAIRSGLRGQSLPYMRELNALTDRAARPWFEHPAYGGKVGVPHLEGAFRRHYGGF